MRAIGYFRVSDEEQMTGYSMDAQRHAFFDFCQQRGWTAVGTYDEEGRSAWVESIVKRPAFRQMLEDAQANKFDVVVTHSVDRFARNITVAMEALRTLARNEVSYVCITQAIDYSTPEGKVFLTMMLAFAEYFSSTLSLHTKKSMRERASRGIHNGAPPFGYVSCTESCPGAGECCRGCHVVPEEADIVVDAFNWYATGTISMGLVAERFNQRGFRTRSKRPLRMFDVVSEANGRRFTNASIRDILKNPFYAGKVKHGEELFDGRHEAIISQHLFGEVQEQMAKNRSHKSVLSDRRRRSPHMLKGLLHCHECGAGLWSQTQGSLGKTYYKVPDKGCELPCKHQGRSFLGTNVEAQVDQLLCWFKLEDEWVANIMGWWGESDLKIALRTRDSIREKLRRAENLYIEGDLDLPEYSKIREQADAALLNLQMPDGDNTIEAQRLLEDFGSLWSEMSVSRKNGLLRQMLDAIYVDIDTRHVVGLVPKEAFAAKVMTMATKAGVPVLEVPSTMVAKC